MSLSSTPRSPQTRPRVAGEREDEILEATFGELLQVGYDRLTFDSVAKRAHASKATLYRRWETKSALVVDAILRHKGATDARVPDEGSLRADLLALVAPKAGKAVGPGQRETRAVAAVFTALLTDPEFAAEFRTRFVDQRRRVGEAVIDRARERGEITSDVDGGLLTASLAGIVLHRSFVLGEPVDHSTLEEIVDTIILPAAGCEPVASTPHSPDQETP
ncbi:TetR/AcrR family transcriptional regulator [Nocardioides marmoribigeumensis]|jgi:AcrR family transcriptional regulator|uniref:AcrR family transcriptional regulator n=1 Tax=Nocardioides marmoribigeumensis TaxID=433649 RepID=A0ABU2BZ57_9ACTN|nr:TetR/AcrR family transcriptional regulator [Nocardioides marmoribigeumensis]MDR7363691.1 AcrR family transcriptional regulator [Nocardioides marmoribigeumensis]